MHQGFYKKLSIHKKLLVLVMSITVSIVLILTGFFLIREISCFRQNLADNLKVLAQAVGHIARPALIEGDPASAQKILNSLKVDHRIESAVLYDASGEILARFATGETERTPILQSNLEGARFTGDRVEIWHRISGDSHPLGYIFFYGNPEELRALIWKSCLHAFLILCVLFGCAYLFSRRTLGIISKPLSDLAVTARTISQQHDYSVRVPLKSEDEWGTLTTVFNEMISQIDKREKQLEYYRVQLEELVEQRTDELEKAKQLLSTKDRLAALGELTAMVSHEIRNPLATVRNSIFTIDYLLKTEDLQLNRALKLAERNVDRCNAIIEELLQFTRKPHLHFEATHVDDWVEEILEEYSFPDCVEVRKRLHARLDLPIDREQLRRAFLNLVQNACQILQEQWNATGNLKSSRPPVLTIESRASDEHWLISVSDNGPGIPPDQVEKIFEPLYSTRAFGVGLGLPIVKQIMDLLKGTISVTTHHTTGTTMTLKLPLEKASVHEPQKN